jgi:very-short-patch-repair endonuclease
VVERFQSQYLPDIELRDLLGLDNSLFDQAASRYRGRIWLQEHFRCMPEIIQFSNRLSYGDHPLVPLRQFGTDRLEPLQSVHVEGAWMRESEQSKINDEEAEAIVERIAKCCADPAYDGASMGVISLLGSGQAMRIRNLLIDRIGPEEMVARRLKCGTAYDFQGDERSVMFLSMVVTPSPDGRRLPALGGKGSEQRFNVAASRAQDQLWLFHSVELHDLNPECVRWKLLSHFPNPPAALEAPEVPGEVHPEILQEPFDSLFEQQVYLRLRERGHTVVPQHRVHGFRIDLVVLGEHSRLAVECDGDEWHGPEQYARDMAHQRDLERCGWRFFRLRASEFYRDPDAALEPLWTLLHERGIAPARAL